MKKDGSISKTSNQTNRNFSKNSGGVSNGQTVNQTTIVETPLEIRFNEAQNNLSSSRKRLLQQILSEPHETFFLSSREMGKRYGVDSATIVRTIQAMGYEKFADFAHDLRNHFVKQFTPYTSMRAATQKNKSVADYVRQSLDTDNNNLNNLIAGIDVDKIIELAQQIHRTRRIIIIGIDYAATLAMSMAYVLVRIGCDAEAPIGSTGVVRNKVKLLTEKDLLIAISFGQGLRETVEAVKLAKTQNVPSFGITDSNKTPIARFCDQYVIASIARASFLDSYVAPMAAINSILTACAHTQTKRALELLEQSEKEYISGTRWYQEDEDSPLRKKR